MDGRSNRIEIKLGFQISPALCGTAPNSSFHCLIVIFQARSQLLRMPTTLLV